MKHLKFFELDQYTEKEIKQYKMSYSQAGKAWKSLWYEHNFFHPAQKFFKIKISLNYDKDEDLGYFEILKYSKENKSYTNLGGKFFRGTPEDRMNFIKWLDELNLINKNRDI